MNRKNVEAWQSHERATSRLVCNGILPLVRSAIAGDVVAGITLAAFVTAMNGSDKTSWA